VSFYTPHSINYINLTPPTPCIGWFWYPGYWYAHGQRCSWATTKSQSFTLVCRPLSQRPFCFLPNFSLSEFLDLSRNPDFPKK